MFESVGNYPQGEGLYLGKGFIPCAPIGHDTRESGNLSDPSAVAFLIDLNFEDHWI